MIIISKKRGGDAVIIFRFVPVLNWSRNVKCKVVMWLSARFWKQGGMLPSQCDMCEMYEHNPLDRPIFPFRVWCFESMIHQLHALHLQIAGHNWLRNQNDHDNHWAMNSSELVHALFFARWVIYIQTLFIHCWPVLVPGSHSSMSRSILHYLIIFSSWSISAPRSVPGCSITVLVHYCWYYITTLQNTFLDMSITGTDLDTDSLTATDLEKWWSSFHFIYFVFHAYLVCAHHLSIIFSSSIIPGPQKPIYHDLIFHHWWPLYFHLSCSVSLLCCWSNSQGLDCQCFRMASLPTPWIFCLP